MRKMSFTDRLLDELQHGLATSHLRPAAAARDYPANDAQSDELSDREQAHVAGLMRVNNAGEVAAQGLYRGQALTAREQALSSAMIEAAEEENEHLNWCQRRLSELDRRRSLLDGVWYWGSFTIGALAGAAGDKWSLGFVRETEQQVCAHLDRHLGQLPAQDERSRSIIETMRADELRHAENAAAAGAAELPQPIKCAMILVSKVMTVTAYRI
jgi:ubiquinone biosynthesis monooxygenase Coq7